MHCKTNGPCVCLQEGLLPMSALCLSHSHSAADMEGLIPASTTASSTSSTCTTTPSSSNSSTNTTSYASNSSPSASTGRGECVDEIILTGYSIVTTRALLSHKFGPDYDDKNSSLALTALPLLKMQQPCFSTSAHSGTRIAVRRLVSTYTKKKIKQYK